MRDAPFLKLYRTLDPRSQPFSGRLGEVPVVRLFQPMALSAVGRSFSEGIDMLVGS